MRGSVEFHDTAAGVEVSIRVEEGSVVGSKSLVAPNCAEAVAGAVTVLTLALSDQAVKEQDEAAPPARLPVEQPAASRVLPPEAAASRHAQSAEALDDSLVMPVAPHPRKVWSAGLMAGVDVNRWSPAPLLEAGLARLVGSGRLAVAVAYVQPVAATQVDVSGSAPDVPQEDGELQYAMTGGAHYCQALAPQLWLSLCAGAQFTAGRYLVRSATEGAWQWASQFGPSVGALWAWERGPIQPRAQLSAIVPMLGEASGMDAVTVRATFGASVGF